ncbi:hypothetical protein TRFO_01150 [Tritrichomonas foetus]|uniref:Uncharacterized protein n=1 Tax=Tritrichomonas foetus TaxID=1144522 RepID=A0A1J4KJD6_9EUKA|nr:hypothetical protein TRFO_01150 [Tritrichomonas foetus]|eukprot:OHT11210.1 hypothetical protein TRFO_01150 [Tritrichomonas foetus]
MCKNGYEFESHFQYLYGLKFTNFVKRILLNTKFLTFKNMKVGSESSKKKHRHHESGSHKHRHHSKKNNPEPSTDQSANFNQPQTTNDSITASTMQTYEEPTITEFSFDEMRDMVDENYYDKAIQPIEGAKRIFVESIRTLIRGYVENIESNRKKTQPPIFNSPNFSIDYPNNNESITNQSFADDISQSTGKDYLYNFLNDSNQRQPTGYQTHNLLDSDDGNSPIMNENTSLSSRASNKIQDDPIFKSTGSESGEIPSIQRTNARPPSVIESDPDIDIDDIDEAFHKRSSPPSVKSNRNPPQKNAFSIEDDDEEPDVDGWSNDSESVASKRTANSPIESFRTRKMFQYNAYTLDSNNEPEIEGII